jgi:hypothetical protein
VGTSPTTHGRIWAATGDLNDDGLVDLVSGNVVTHNLTVVFQAPGGVFPATPSVTLGGPSTTFGPRFVTTADLNGDGLIDIVSMNQTGGNLALFFQTSPGVFPVTPSAVLPIPSPYFVDVADLDGDGLVEVIVAYGTVPDGIAVFRQTSLGRFSPTPSFSLPDVPSGQPGCVIAGDLNQDGQPDLVMSGSGRVSLFFSE